VKIVEGGDGVRSCAFGLCMINGKLVLFICVDFCACFDLGGRGVSLTGFVCVDFLGSASGLIRVLGL
jgi:hypothetical protein